MLDFTFQLIVLLNAFLLCDFHPQCLNYKPPHSPKQPLKFCRTYGSYGCCIQEDDEKLKQTYDNIVNNASNVSEECVATLKEFLCLQCHPYAAHVYDAEISYENETFRKADVNFPGLCYRYCIEKFLKCKELFSQLPVSDVFRTFMRNSTKREFCEWAAIPDKAYCYPAVRNVNNKIDLNRRRGDNNVEICVEPDSNSFANALVAVHSNDKTHRLFIGEQRGMVFILDHTWKRLSAPFLDIRGKIINSGQPWDERGFLGLVFHPKYKENGRFYVYYSTPNNKLNRANYSTYEWFWKVTHSIRISEFTVDPNNPNVADHNSELILLEIAQPAANHNGGMLLFGEDGYLYIFVGDGGGAGDPFGNGLKMSTLLGKVLRIDVNIEDKLYGIPNDNPFVDVKNTRQEIYAYGIRNIWRCSSDRGDEKGVGKGRIMCGDVGQSKYEEIDLIEKGKNYGWSAFEGFACYNRTLCRQAHQNLAFPVLTYNHTVGQSIVGGYIYRGCKNPVFYGKYFYGDTMNGRIFIAKEINNRWFQMNVSIGNSSICNRGLINNYFRNILSFGETEAGELYILSARWPNPNYMISRLFRLVDPYLRGDPELCKLKVKEPVALKTIRRRKIYKEIIRPKRSENMKHVADICSDSSPQCKQHFKEVDGKKPKYDCKTAKAYAMFFCKKTCNYC